MRTWNRCVVPAAILSNSLMAASFQEPTQFTLTPSSGKSLNPAADSNATVYISQSPGSYPAYQNSFIRPPSTGQTISLSTPANSASLSLLNVSTGPAETQYSLSATGAYADPSQVIDGWGPDIYSVANYESMDALAGIFAPDFSCTADAWGVTEGSECYMEAGVLTEKANGSNDFFTSIERSGLEVRGQGQATWTDGSITASGSDYTLEIQFKDINSAAGYGIVTAQQGIVVSSQNINLPYLLRQAGASGDFTILAPLTTVSFDFRPAAQNDPFVDLSFTTPGNVWGGTAQAGSPPPTAAAPLPEPAFGWGIGAAIAGLTLSETCWLLRTCSIA